LCRVVLSIDIARSAEIIALFTHNRVVAKDDLELIRDCFQVTEATVPQLICVHNPVSMVAANSSSQQIQVQHDLFVDRTIVALDECVSQADNSLERRLYSRMKERLSTFLFVSHTQSRALSDMTSAVFSTPKQACLSALVTQRLKPAKSYVLSVITELKVSLLGSRAIKAPLISEDFFNPSADFEVQWQSVYNGNPESLLQDAGGNFSQYFRKTFATKEVVAEMLSGACQYFENDASLRLFISFHKRFVDPSTQLSNTVFDELKAEFRDALDNIDSLAQTEVAQDLKEFRDQNLRCATTRWYSLLFFFFFFFFFF